MAPPADGSDAPPDVQRLERRLKREREARLAAEAIAEKGLRDLFEHQQRLSLLEAVATAANQTASVDEVLRHALEQVCAFTGWSVGHVYLARGGAVLLPTPIWHGLQGDRHGEFRDLSERMRFRLGEGLPGRVLASGEPAWISELAVDRGFPRAATALACGLHAALAFPVLVGREVTAVLEFFSENPRAPDAHLLRVMAQIGTQLGRVIERGRSDRRLRDGNRQLQRLVEEAEAQRNAAEAASRAKSAFLAVTSHEVRTPLNAVLGLAEALKREPLSHKQAALTQGVLDSGAMLLRLLNAVLDVSRAEAGERTLAVAPFDLARTLETVAEVWGAQARSSAEVDIALDLAALPRPCRVVSDEAKVEQTLISLVSNAVKFSPRGGRVWVRASAVPADAGLTVRIEVVDQGPGLDPDDRLRVFQPFEQTEAGRQAGGAGLGLSICAGNMALLGGEIAADRTDAGESRFWFAFPAAPAQAPAVADDAAAAPELDRPLRVLAAEDNPANRHVLEVLLEPAGLSLEFVVNGAEAVEAVQARAYDLVLMDVNMPVMDGVAAVLAIRAAETGADRRLIYMLTANAFDEDVRRYMAAGADGVLKKPIDLPLLYAALEHAATRAVG